MTRVDFYVLPDLRLDARELFAGRLAVRAFRAGMQSLIQVADDAAATRLDESLWQQPDGAFLPHVRLGSPLAARTPVTVATAEELEALAPEALPVHDLLINLQFEIPTRFAAFDRVAEIVCQDETVRAAGRANYRFYRQRGYPLHHHDLAQRRTP